MSDINCLIIDDELSDSAIIEQYIHQTTGLRLVAKCVDVNCIQEILKRYSVSVIFFDINVHKNNRFDLIKELGASYPIILTSAIQDYAIEGFDLDVIDYLLKPILYPRFLKAISKLKNRISEKYPIPSDYLFIKSGNGIEKINFSDIMYIKASGNYVRIYLDKKTIISYTTLKNIEHTLPHSLFLKVQKSFIVALHKIKQIEGNKILIEDICIPISRLYKHRVIDKLTNQNFDMQERMEFS